MDVDTDQYASASVRVESRVAFKWHRAGAFGRRATWMYRRSPFPYADRRRVRG
jgi:hypothetical protein